jgi:Tfp pilus assembly protein PilF
MRRLTLLLLLALAIPALANEEHPHMEMPGNFGIVHFPTSCTAAAQPKFERGVAILHSFGYEKARSAFEDVAKQDPHCAIAYWGIAMTQYHGLWEQIWPAEGKAAVERARAIATDNSKTSARERAYIEALGNIFDDASKPLHEREVAYEQAMATLHADNPDDTEGTIFYALALDVDAPKTDKTYAHQRQARDLLLPIFQKQPNHPGLAHYIIHTSDFPPLAADALPAARRYAQIAPASPHAQHMPSHIFTRLGLWDESIASNRASAASAERDQQTSKTNEAYNQRLHALDYLEYAFLQEGRVVDARETLVIAQKMRTPGKQNNTGGYAEAAIPARFALELKHWPEAARFADPAGQTANDAITWYAKGIAIAQAANNSQNRMREDTQVRNIVGKLYEIRQKLAQSGDHFWSDQVEVQRLQVLGWAEMLERESDSALARARAAADLEDSTEKPPVTPGPVLPARENLANMLLALNRPADALVEYEAVLKGSPYRRNALLGAVQSARAAGDNTKASQYQAALDKLLKRKPALETVNAEKK